MMGSSSTVFKTGLPLVACLAGCSTPLVSLPPNPAPENPVAMTVESDGDVVLAAALAAGTPASQVIIEVQTDAAPVPETLLLHGASATATFVRQSLSPAGLTMYRVPWRDRASSRVDLGGLSQFEGRGIQDDCVILRQPRWMGGEEITRSLSCLTSPGDNPTPPPGGDVLELDQISLTADTFFLAQTSDTGIVGFGPISGPKALDDDFAGPGSSAFPDNGIREVSCGLNPFFQGGVAPVLLLDQELGVFTFTRNGVLAPSTTLGVTQPNSVTLSNQQVFLIRDGTDQVTLQFSPANFDEIYRINYFETRNLTFKTADCEQTGQEFSLSFSETTVAIDEVVNSATVLFTLRGTSEGIDAPNQGVLQGATVISDASLPQGLVATADPRFAGVVNLRDVSGNQIRTDAALVFDQIGGQPTQGAIQELPIGSGFSNPASGSPPFVTGSPQKDGQQCPSDPDRVCGRFQFNQPFPQTAGPDGDGVEPDLLLITGTFTGRLR